MKTCAGDWVEVRSREEILRTLDKNGRLDELPFMPQMFEHCGRRFLVRSSAYKTCDTVTGHYVGRRLPDAVHLDVRCDGRDVWRATKSEGADGETIYSCQATELLNYTTPLKWWDARQYLEAYTSGNRTLPEICRGLFYLFYYYATLAFSDRWGRPARWLYNKFQAVTGGIPFPRLKGRIPVGQPAPRRDLGLQPGDLVRVKSYDEILATLDTRLSNRGLWFDAELVPFCGKVFRVSTCVERFVDEKSGKMRRMKTPAVMLDGVTCKALFSGQRMFCPRGINLWWREIWLERVSTDAYSGVALPTQAGTCTTADKGPSSAADVAAPEWAATFTR